MKKMINDKVVKVDESDNKQLFFSLDWIVYHFCTIFFAGGSRNLFSGGINYIYVI